MSCDRKQSYFCHVGESHHSFVSNHNLWWWNYQEWMFYSLFCRFPLLLPILEPEYAVNKIMNAILTNQRVLIMPKILYFLLIAKRFALHKLYFFNFVYIFPKLLQLHNMDCVIVTWDESKLCSHVRVMMIFDQKLLLMFSVVFCPNPHIFWCRNSLELVPQWMISKEEQLKKWIKNLNVTPIYTY